MSIDTCFSLLNNQVALRKVTGTKVYALTSGTHIKARPKKYLMTTPKQTDNAIKIRVAAATKAIRLTMPSKIVVAFLKAFIWRHPFYPFAPVVLTGRLFPKPPCKMASL